MTQTDISDPKEAARYLKAGDVVEQVGARVEVVTVDTSRGLVLVGLSIGDDAAQQRTVSAADELLQALVRARAVAVDQADEQYGAHDYVDEPIGDDNPYHACVHCGLSGPAINGQIRGHHEWCAYRVAKETGAQYPPAEDEDS